MAACGAAVEAAYWGKKYGVKVTLVDKAALDRSGAVMWASPPSISTWGWRAGLKTKTRLRNTLIM